MKSIFTKIHHNIYLDMKANNMNNLFDLIDSVDIVSFDVFDTLILRPFVKPQDVFGYLEKATGAIGFAKNRMESEKKARILKMAKYKQEDCTIDDIYELLDSQYQCLQDKEIIFEEQIATSNQKVYNFYQYALKQNKKIIITTDTYLPKNIIEKILLKNNIKIYDEIFISSQIGLSKASGNLFSHIISKCNIDSSKILHIGDNIISDIENSNKNGLKTYHIKPLVLEFFDRQENKYLIPFLEKYNDNPIVSAILGLRILNYNKESNFWVNLGFNYGGILAIEMTLNAIKIAEEKKLSDLFFIARDSFLPEEIFHLFNNNPKLKGHYITLNRVIKYKYKKTIKNDSNELYKYLNSIKTNGNNIGIVDTSAGTFSAQNILQDYLPNLNFYGIYLHTRENHIYIFENLSNLSIDEAKKIFNLNFIEILLTSLEPKIEDLKDSKPIYEQNENIHETTKRKFYCDILKGERLFVNLFKQFFIDFLYPEQINIIYEYIGNYWNNLSNLDKQHLSQIKNSVDTQQTQYISLIDSKQEIASILSKREREREEELLKNYYKYDYLNRYINTIKILVGYIKPSFLFKSSILIPIHLGRAVEKEKSKDGIISESDLMWLHDNCVSDADSDDNISIYNRRVGFFTGTYWAWKNYDKLGNPDYFGSFGYRRLLNPSFLDNLTQYDCILPNMVYLSKSETLKTHIIKLHGLNLYNITINIFNKRYPNESVFFEEYLQSNCVYLYEIYVMKKAIFFDFCAFMFPLLCDFLSIDSKEYAFNCDILEANYIKERYELRDVGYIMEFITGYCLHKLKNDKSIKCKNQNMEYFLYQDTRNNILAKLLRQNIKNRHQNILKVN